MPPTTTRRANPRPDRTRSASGARSGVRRASASRSRLLSGPGPRRLLAAALAALSVGGLGLLATHRSTPDGVPVVVATREVSSGAPLAGATAVRYLPAAAVPATALTQGTDLTGRRSTSPLAAGEILTEADAHLPRLLGPDGDGRAVFVPVPEPPVLAAVTVGDLLDVHSPVDGSPVVLGARVISTHPGERGGLWLEVTAEQSRTLAAARGADPAGGSLLLALHPSDDDDHPRP